MMLRRCPREKEVKELVERGHWPQACAPELRAHVNDCRSCGELVLVTSAFQKARIEAAGAAKLGSPGVLWWRAQLRRRNEAVERIGRPTRRCFPSRWSRRSCRSACAANCVANQRTPPPA